MNTSTQTKNQYEQIKNLFLNDKLQPKDIAVKTGFCVSYVRQMLRKQNIKMRSQEENLTNQRFGKLVALNRVPDFKVRKTKGAVWRCLCDCGKEHIVRAQLLIAKLTKSCGCYRKRHQYKEMRGDYLIGIVRDAKIRNKEYNISPAQIWELYLRQDRKCAMTKIPITFGKSGIQTCSLDRIDSQKGYTIDNIQWVHKIVNKMKSNLPQSEFINWCKLIAINHATPQDLLLMN